jgi:predicted DNA-binding protein
MSHPFTPHHSSASATKQIVVSMPLSLINRLKAAADASELTQAELVRQMVTHCLGDMAK